MATWKIDPAHSEVKFKVKHLVVSTVTGHFNHFQATIDETDGGFESARISFEADVDSVDTKNAQRDSHLKSADFFDAANHPKLTFNSTSITKSSDSNYTVLGNLTIRGTTRPVRLDVVHNGVVKGFGGGDVSGFEIAGKINRRDFGLTWNGLTEAGGVVVSDDVTLEIFAEFTTA